MRSERQIGAKVNLSLTQNRWDEAEAVGQHRPLDDVEFGQDFEGKQADSEDVKRLGREDHSEFSPRKASDALEEPQSQ